jgi:hypothetical protein
MTKKFRGGCRNEERIKCIYKEIIMRMRITITWLTVLFIMLVNCASVPKSILVLNSKVSNGLDVLEEQNLKLLDVYHEMVISKVNSDLEKILDNSRNIFIAKNGKEPVTKDDYYQIAVIAIKQRDRIIGIVNDSINAMKDKISKNYKEVQDVNNEMSMYLASLVKLKDSGNQLREIIKSQTGIDFDFKKEFSEINAQIDSFLKGDDQK